MPPRGKESIIRRQKEIARQQKAKAKAAKRDEKRLNPGSKGSGSGEISPDDLVTLEELVGPMAGDSADDGKTDDDAEPGA